MGNRTVDHGRPETSQRGARVCASGGRGDSDRNRSVGIPERRIARFQPEDCLLARIEAIVGAGEHAVIHIEGAGRAWIDERAGTYAVDYSDASAFLSSSSCVADVRAASMPPDQPRRALSELRWQVAYHGSDGALLNGCHPYDVIQLRRWPNLTRVAHSREMIPLCALLASRPASLAFARRMLGMSESDAHRFYSAARAAGLVRIVSAQPERPEPSDDGGPEPSGAGGSSLWRRLFQRIARL